MRVLIGNSLVGSRYQELKWKKIAPFKNSKSFLSDVSERTCNNSYIRMVTKHSRALGKKNLSLMFNIFNLM